MKPAKTIPLQSWMQTPEIKAVFDALGEGDALLVGGCVRNQVLNKPVEDIDIATKLKPDEAIEKLNTANIKTIPTGIDHGTITAIAGKQKFEITTLRTDQKTDGRHAQVQFSDDWVEDAKRRDFTINTLLMDLQGNIFDPTGQGIEHIEQRKIIFVGDPEKRIAEDHLRILRFFRFHALYGTGEPSPAALNACQAASDKIQTLSRERITQEFFKILMVDNPRYILNLMNETKALEQIIPSAKPLEQLSALSQLQTTHALKSLSSRLLTLADFSVQNLKAYTQTLLIPKTIQKESEAITKILTMPDLSNHHAMKVALYKHGRAACAQAYLIEVTQNRVDKTNLEQALNLTQNWKIPTFPTTGNDLMAQGFKQGTELGEELDRLEGEWIEGGFS